MVMAIVSSGNRAASLMGVWPLAGDIHIARRAKHDLIELGDSVPHERDSAAVAHHLPGPRLLPDIDADLTWVTWQLAEDRMTWVPLPDPGQDGREAHATNEPQERVGKPGLIGV